MVLIKISSINTIYYTNILFFLSSKIIANISCNTSYYILINRKFSLKNFKYQADMEKGDTTAWRNGTSLFTLDSAAFKMGNQTFDFAVDKIKAESKQSAKDNKYAMEGQSEVENFRINNIKFAPTH